MRSKARLASALLLAAVFLAPAVAVAKPKIVAVFDVQDRTGKLDAKALGQLTDYLAAQVTSRGFRVLPRSQLKARLRAQKKESYKSCYDEKCQIEVGREMAAQKSLSTQIVQVGSKCAVVMTLYDLRTSASEKAATKKGACDVDALVTSLEGAVTMLGTVVPKGATAPVPPQQAEPEHTPPPQAAPPPAQPAVQPRAAATPLPAAVDPTPAPTEPASKPFYKKWWFWTVVGVAVVGAVVVGVLASGGADETTANSSGMLKSGLDFSW